MQKNNKKLNRKNVDTLRERERERESRNLKRESSRKLKVLNLNLSATMVVAVIIAIIIIAIIAVKMIVTAINSNSQKAMAGEETQGYTMVDSTELGEDGKPLQVPVPDGFTASQVPGETTVNGGFVIYEGEVDWSKIEDLSSYAEVKTQELTDKEEEKVSTESINLDENINTDSNTNSENINTAENENSTSNIDEEGANTEGNRVNTSASEENNTTANKEAENNIESPDSNIVGSSENKTKSTGIEKTEETKEEQGEEKNIEETTETEGNIEERKTAEKELKEEESQEEQEKEKTNGEETLNNENTGIATMSEEENGGITTLAEGETPTTVFELQTSRNQYVWVPVKDVSRIYGIDSNGKLWGKLYNYSKTATSRSPYWSESNGVMGSQKNAYYREPDVTRSTTSYDRDSRIQGYLDGIERYQMLSQEMEESYYRMIESVKKYGGFYIGRYETGDLGEEEAVVRKMNEKLGGYINETYITWYVMYEKSKNLAGANENVETSMIWGSLWDETIQWLIDTEAAISTGEKMTYDLVAKDSMKWGNYSDATFEYKTTSGGTSTKNKGSNKMIPTGSAEYTKANNIYDLAGNVYDWTLEIYSNSNNNRRVCRGGECFYSGSGGPAGSRHEYNPTTYSSNLYFGCRSALYIK